MTIAEWVVSDDPVHALRPICGTPCGTERRLRLYAHACCTRISAWLPDALYRAALDVLERAADGAAGVDEWIVARAATGAHVRQLAAALFGPEQWDSMDPRVALERRAAHHAGRAVSAAFEAGDVNDPCPDWINQLVADVIAATQLGTTLDPATGLLYSTVSVAVLTRRELTSLVREVFSNPFRAPVRDPAWLSSDALALARQMYESRDFDAMPILADALQDAGCESADILDHCRGPGPHVRGCWVVDLVLGKE